jgi:hypothetical protein
MMNEGELEGRGISLRGDSMRRTWKEGSFIVDPERYVNLLAPEFDI